MIRRYTCAPLLAISAALLASACGESDIDEPGGDVGGDDTSGDVSSDGTDTDLLDVTDAGDTVADTIDAGDTAVDTADDASDSDGGDADVEHDGSGHETAHWSYEGETGPEFWGELDPAWAMCSEGVEQSPIDFGHVAPRAEIEVEAEYGPVPLFVENNGHTIEVPYEGGGVLMNAFGTFETRQFHFHTPSEHQVGGNSYPLEMHIVHQNEAGERAVLGVFFEAGEPNDAFGTIVANAPFEAETTIEVVDTTIDILNLLPDSGAGWSYPGSLTTPDCAEAVSWQVLWTPVTASTEQIDALRAIIEPNARPVQPLGERHIDGAHFEYEGSDGPEYWGELSPVWETCGTGEAQSPIDISSEWLPVDQAPIEFDYNDSPVTVSNNGHTVQFDYAPGSTMTVGEESWELIQFHFHVGSEHTFDTVQHPLELHFVHRNEAGELAVFGVSAIVTEFFGEELDLITDYLADAGHHPETVEGATINAAGLIPETFTYIAYDGSLTTPPCTEGVRWFVSRFPLFASADQISAFTDVFTDTARDVQPLNGRLIE